jgi:hypothetical protein
MNLWRRHGPHAALHIAVATVPAALSGCTLIGAGIGAGIDSATPGPYEERPPAERVRLERRERIIVHLRHGARVSGRYMGVHGPTRRDPESYLLVDTEARVRSLRTSDVCAISVEVSGKGWLYGGLIGVAIDATLVVATVVALQNMDWNGNWSNGSDGGCFC